jgi:hypothetical protein
MAILSSALNIFGAVLLAHAYVIHLAVGHVPLVPD